MAFNRKNNGVNGVFFVGIKALTAFNRKNSGVFPEKFDPGTY